MSDITLNIEDMQPISVSLGDSVNTYEEGQLLYDIIVPDDYSTLAAALTAAEDGQSIYIKSGSYTEAGGAFSQNGIEINGGGAVHITLSGNLTLNGDRVTLRGVEIDTNSGKKLELLGSYCNIIDSRVTNGTVEYFLKTGSFCGFSNNTVIASGSGGRVYIGERNRVTGSHFTVPHMVNGGIDLSFYSTFTGNFIYRQDNAISYDQGYLLRAWGERCVISGNSFFCGGSGAINTDLRCTITGNSIFQGAGEVVSAREGSTISGNVIGFFGVGTSAIFLNNSVDSFSTIITGNNLSGSGSTYGFYDEAEGETGINVSNATRSTVISANSVTGVEVGVLVGANAIDTLISANSFRYVTSGVSDAGTGTIIVDNIGTSNDLIGSSWGGITGTLSSQTDLQSALNGKMTSVAPGTSGNVLTSNGTTWESAAPTGGGGGRELVGEAVIDTNGYGEMTTISGLDLATDGMYQVEFLGQNSSSSDTDLTLRLNGVSQANQYRMLRTLMSQSTTEGAGSSNMSIINGQPYSYITMSMTMEVAPDSSVVVFQGQASSTVYDTGLSRQVVFSGQFTRSNITSIGFQFWVGLTAGSRMRVYKLG